MRRPYTVTIEVVKSVEFDIDDCNSPEEAEEIATQRAIEDDFAYTNEISKEVFVIESFAKENGVEENDEEPISA